VPNRRPCEQPLQRPRLHLADESRDAIAGDAETFSPALSSSAIWAYADDDLS
jgi:hypothetical protein